MITPTIITAITFAVNCFALCAVLVFLAKWLRRIERKIDDYSDYAIKTKFRLDSVYVNMLCELRRSAIANGKLEDADKLTQEIDRIMKEP